MPNSKQCSMCGEVKPLDEFHRRKASRDGRQQRCKTCVRAWCDRPEVKAAKAAYDAEYRGRPENKERHSAQNAEYYRANRDAILARMAEYMAEYQDRNPHIWWESAYRQRARAYGFDPVVESFTRDDLIAKYGDRCFHCNGPFEELDHSPAPVAHGGSHTIDNCKPSCAACNRKGTGVRTQNKEKV